MTVMVVQTGLDGLGKVDFCHFEERSDEKSLDYSGDFSLRSK